MERNHRETTGVTAPSASSRGLAIAVFTGLGVGMNLASVSSAAISAVTGEQLSSGAAVLNISRQIGVALGGRHSRGNAFGISTGRSSV